MKADPPYQRLGTFIARKREAAAMSKQADLARRVGCSQQAVSRWEAGLSRPRQEQLAALATALGVKSEELSELAGYAPPEAIATTLPLPVDRLSPEAFEHFVEYMLSLRYPEASVTRAGKTGHSQAGTDVLARFPTGRVLSVQCKRVSQFGPEDARRVIRDHTVEADEKILALSRVASPQTAEVFADLVGWELWDSDRLTRMFRLELTPDQQDRLVDVFFRGQRRSLTGRSEPGPWQTANEFFEPFVGRGTIFSHDLDLIGRETEITSLGDFIKSDARLIFLVAGGGMGKSRLLKEAIARVEASDPLRVVRLLSPAAEVTRASIEALGPHSKVLVVDDAHDRDGLAGLIEMAANPSNQVQLLVSTRPYAEARIRREAALYSIESPPIVKLGRLTKSEIKALAVEALTERGAPEEWADSVVAAANDSPLVAVMAARLVAKDRVPVELVKNAEILRSNIMGRFEGVITGDLGEPGDEPNLKSILRVLALVQPFHHSDPGLLALIEQTVGIGADDASRLMRLLVDGGVVYQRGTQFRLMPDLLGDYIIETSCVGLEGALTPFAKRAWEEARPNQVASILVNLGRLDWRRSDGDPSNSKLLEPFWRDLETITSSYDERFAAIRSVAVFQPRQALEFVQAQIGAGLNHGALTGILRSIAYSSSDYLDDVCAILWEMGRNDRRETSPHPDHAMRVLADLARFERRKPLSINDQVLKFGLDLLGRPDAWQSHYTPLDVLEPMLSTEGTTTESTGRAFSFSSFLVNRDVVKPIREKVIEQVIQLLHHTDPFISYRAGRALQDAVRLPSGMMGGSVPDSYIEAYRKEFAETLERVHLAIERQPLPFMTPIAIAESVSWLAGHSKGRVAKKAQDILALQPQDIRFRLRAALVDGFGRDFRRGRSSGKNWEKDFQDWISNLSGEICDAYPEGEALRQEIEDALKDIQAVRASDGSSYALVGALLGKHPTIRQAIIEDAIRRPDSPTLRYVGSALQGLMEHDRDRGRALTRDLIKSSDLNLRVASVSAYWGVAPSDEDLEFFTEVLSSSEAALVFEALRIVMRLELPQRSKIDLTKGVNFNGSHRIADEVALIWRDINGEGDALINEADAEHFLSQALTVPELKGHWLGELLASFSERFPYSTIRFFTDRVLVASKRDDLDMRPVNYGPWIDAPLRFAKGPHATEIFRFLWSWLQEHSELAEGFFRHHASHLFEAVFKHAPEHIVSHFDMELGLSGRKELNLMAVVLRESKPSFVFEHRDFVIRYLERCKSVDQELTDDALSSLYAAASSFMRTGTVGEPMPQDVELRDNAKEALKHVSRLAPAHKLYTWLLRNAEADIERSRAEGAALDDEE